MKKRVYLLISVILILAACGGSKTNNPTPAPQKALLILPAQNELCNQGTLVSGNQSNVTFQWNSGSNAESYELDVKNLLTGTVTSQSTSGTKLTVTLPENTPFSWSVTSKSSKSTATATTDTWKFYNSGPGTLNYAPFPAELVSPSLNQTISATNGKITVSWIGSDVDNDVLTYDLYLNTSPNPGLLKSGIASLTYDVAVSAGTTYYWKIVTTDAYGNSSQSEIERFTVN